jgi:ribosomal protein L37E
MPWKKVPDVKLSTYFTAGNGVQIVCPHCGEPTYICAESDSECSECGTIYSMEVIVYVFEKEEEKDHGL